MASWRVLASGFGLVEGPTFGPDGELYVSDVLKGGVVRIAPTGEVETVIPKRRGVGGIALHADGGLVVSGRDVQHVRDGQIRTVLAPDEGVTGFNDLCCDAAGHIYVGAVRFMVFDPDAVVIPGELLRVPEAGRRDVVVEGVGHTNGVGLTADGRTLFHSDSRGGVVLVLTLDAEGSVLERRDVALSPGVPDGLAVDAEGCAWVALAGGGSIVRVTPEGEVRERVPVPAEMVTSVCFGDGQLVAVSADNTEPPPLGGCVFVTPTDVVGAPVHPARV
jgi:gluconolactonase